jgi:hypothetical protein
MSYRKVVPRDLFNESKLLKCLGKVSVMILDGNFSPYGLKDAFDDEQSDRFLIDLDGESALLYCSNYHVFDKNGVEIELGSRYNSKDPWPLEFIDRENYVQGEVFNDDGTVTDEFIEFLEAIE